MYFHYSHLYIAIKPLLPWYCWSMMVTYFQIFHFVTFFNPYISPYIIKSIRITSIPRKIPIFLGFKPCFCHSLPTPSTRKLDRQGDPSDGPLPQPYIEVAVPGYSPVTWLERENPRCQRRLKKLGTGKSSISMEFFFLTPRTWRVYSMVTPTKRWFNTLHLLFQLYSGSNDVKWDLYPLNKNEICGPQGLRQRQNYAILCDFAILWWQGEYFIIFFVFLFNGQVSSSGLDQLPSPAASTAERAPGYSLCIKFQWIFQ